MAASLVTPIVCLAGLLASTTGAIYWQLAFCLFGAASALQLTALGNATITPGPLFLPFLLFRAWTENHRQGYLSRVPRSGVWLGMAVLFGVLTAMYVPRALEGTLQIMTVDMSSGSTIAALYPLHPVSGNITQSGYAVGHLLAFVAFHALLARPGRMDHFRNAVLLLAALDVAAALINLAEFHLGFPPVLQYVRTAYALFGAYRGAGGLMRIHGTFPETSAFCTFTLPLFAFTFRLWMDRVRPMYSGSLATALLALLLLSTSTTAYVGLALYIAMLTFSLTHHAYLRGVVPRLGLLVAGTLLALVLFGSLFVLETAIGQRMLDYFDVTVINKLASSSGQERSRWNAQAWLNFLDTFGLGVGLGSARASSLPLVLLSNLGLLGTLCFCAFLRDVLKEPARTEYANPTRDASRQAVLGAVAAGIVSATVFDLGIAFYAFSAAACCKPALVTSEALHARLAQQAGPFQRQKQSATSSVRPQTGI
jgi:hypothetical protein